MSGVLVVLLSTIVSAGASATAAWWGGKLGVRREAERLIQARAFDRRLDWYERVIRGLAEYSIAHKGFFRAALRPDQKSIEKYSSQVSKTFPDLMNLLNEGVLYGRPSSAQAIAMLLLEFQAVMRPSSEETPPPSHEEIRAISERIESATARASAALVREAREHMRLEPLPDKIIVEVPIT